MMLRITVVGVDWVREVVPDTEARSVALKERPPRLKEVQGDAQISRK